MMMYHDKHIIKLNSNNDTYCTHNTPIPATVGHNYILYLSDRYTPPPPSTNVLKTRSDRTNPELELKGKTPLKEANLRKTTDYVKHRKTYLTDYTIMNHNIPRRPKDVGKQPRTVNYKT